MFSKWIDAGRSVSAAVGSSIGAAFAFFAAISKAAVPGNTSGDTSVGGETESSFEPALMAQIPPSDAEDFSAGDTPLGGSGLFDDTLSADDASPQVAQDSSIMTDAVDGTTEGLEDDTIRDNDLVFDDTVLDVDGQPSPDPEQVPLDDEVANSNLELGSGTGERNDLGDLVGGISFGDDSGDGDNTDLNVPGTEFWGPFGPPENLAPTDIILSSNSIIVSLTTGTGGVQPQIVLPDSATGSLIGFISAVDPNDPNETKTFEIVDDPAGAFLIRDGNALWTKPGFDAAPMTFQVTIRVTDSGGLFLDETFDIFVLPVDAGLPPIIGDQDLALNENSTSVTPGVDADDPDAGDVITYAIDGGADAGLFGIDTNTGVITANNPFDFETQAHTYTVQVKVTDSTGQTDMATITINLLDIEPEIAPTIENQTLEIDENAIPVTPNVDAAGSSPSDGISFAFAPGGDSGLFTINSSTGEIRARNPFDFEQDDQTYTVQVRVTGGAGTSTATVTIEVQDLQEDVVIENQTLTVLEGTANITPIVAADDEDFADNVASFAIVGGDNGFFIDNAGNVTSNIVFDFDLGQRTFEIVVQATSSDGSTDTANVTIRVLESAEDPVLSVRAQGYDLLENELPVGEQTSSVPHDEVVIPIPVTATDDDPGEQATLQFSISGGPDSSLFTINANTGQISANNQGAGQGSVPGSFNWDPDLQGNPPQRTFTFDVRVTDTTGRTDTETVQIFLQQVDEDPIPIPGTEIAENSLDVLPGIGFLDPDGGDTLTFVISGGAHGFLFVIDRVEVDANNPLIARAFLEPASGTPFDFENPPAGLVPDPANGILSFVVEVSVSDGGPFVASTHFINLLDVNDAPVITVNSVTLDENQMDSNENVAAADDDAGDPLNTLTFALTGNGPDDALFTINANGANAGQLVAIAPFDFETDAATYTVEVQVSDDEGATDTQQIQVFLQDVNEAPSVLPNTYELTENTTAVMPFFQGDDPDVGDAANLVYSIVGGSGLGSFTIDAATGELTATANFNFETNANPTLNIQVEDPDGLTDSQVIEIVLVDANDDPAITSNGGGDTADVDVQEDTTAVTTVTADDEDQPGDVLTFSIVGGVDQGSFNINANTGALTFGAAPDFENPGDQNADNDYVVQVRVDDNNGGTDVQTITVHVTNVNEDPIITSDGGGAAANLNVDEQTTAVTTVTASDGDLDNLTFSISGGVDAADFDIDANSGVLTFNPAPDFEQPSDSDGDNDYIVEVTVSDGTGGTDTQVITVTVDNVNEKPEIQVQALELQEGQVSVTPSIGTLILDPDFAQTFTFTLDGSFLDGSLFNIDAGTGDITYTGPLLDFESDDLTYTIRVRVEDQDGGQDTEVMQINLTNANDAPDILPGQVISMFENVAAGETTIADITNDPEEAIGAETLTYSLNGGLNSALFTVDAADGTVRAVTPFDFENLPGGGSGPRTYEISVTVTDQGAFGGPVMTDTEVISIQIQNGNDAPELTPGQLLTVAENQTNVVGMVQASDPELADEPQLSYEIVGGTGQAIFEIVDNAGNGEVSVISGQEIDFEALAPPQQFTLQIRVSDPDGATDTGTVTIQVTDVNEEPTITPSQNFDIDDGTANADNGAVVGTVQTQDPDAGDFTTSFTITDGDLDGVFLIDVNGEITLNKDLDFETFAVDLPNGTFTNQGNGTATAVLTIEATDSLGLIASGTVTVTLVDQNDNAPSVDMQVFNIDEGVSAVGPLAVSDDDFDTVFTSFTIVGGDPLNDFDIDSNGVITFNGGAIDFENLPNAFGINPLDDQLATATLSISVSDGVNADAAPVDIQIILSNTNEAPIINSDGGGSVANLQIVENTTAVTDVVATDEDGDTVNYSITGGADQALFQVDAVTGALSFINAPDFEMPGDTNNDNFYIVEVTADDGNGLTDAQTIVVEVTDENEAPVITSDSGGAAAMVQIDENSTAVTQVTADDEDALDVVTFSISGGVDAGFFTIDANTGQLSFTAPPDFETPADNDGQNDYVVQVTAEDTDGLTDTQIITVDVQDQVGNESPNITSDGAGDTAALGVTENTSAVTTVTADDDDLDVPTFAITGGDDAALFQIDAVTGVLTFINAPDFEAPADAGADNDYVVIVQADDGNGGTDTQTITVSVTNSLVNEPPVIDSDGGRDFAALQIFENTTAVTTVAAHDDDGGPITFSITGGADQALFQINANSGELSFINAPDFENPADVGADNDYEVVVTATDNGPLTDSQTITVTVEDQIGNESPVITSDGGGDAAAVGIDENTTAITTVTAVDQDLDVPTFAITGGEDAALFQIDAVTGDLTFVNAPNFELPGDFNGGNDYIVEVTADDGNGGTDTQTITVTVSDSGINEAPIITSDGGGDNAAVAIFENTTAVTTVVAVDDPADTPTFAITGGADMALFQIDANTGELSFINAPDFENPLDVGADNDYVVQVTADDGLLTDTQTITVTVQDGVTNEAPVITSDGGGAAANVAATENSTAVATVVAQDDDLDLVTYSISGGADAAFFEIDANTGDLTFINAPDFENPLDAGAGNDYEVTVTADDGNSGTDTQAITVTVGDDPANEAPVITSSATANVVENTTPVLMVTAIDDDLDVPTFSITGGDDQALFTVDTVTGDLSFVNAPDFEAPGDANGDNDYIVEVTADDGNGGTDTQSITVTVTNDPASEAPEIEDQIVTIDELAETANGPVIAFDPEVSVGAEVLTYTIVGGSAAGFFAIDQDGNLTTTVAGGFEFPGEPGWIIPEFSTLQVQVDDGTSTDTATVTVQLLNLDDPGINDRPTINDQMLSFDETTAGATVIGTLIASDPDILPPDDFGQTLTFAVIGGNTALFSVDAVTGEVTLLSPIDFETNAGPFTLQVQVTDSSGDLFNTTDTATVTIEINDIDEANAPDQGFGTDEDNALADQLDLGPPVAPINMISFTAEAATYDLDGPASGMHVFASGATLTVNDDGTFSFDPNGGYEGLDTGEAATETFTFTISSGSETDTSTVTITIDGVNDAPLLADQVLTLDEGATDALGFVPATDVDGEPLTYSITAVQPNPAFSAHAGLFDIDAATGQISLSGPILDFELNAEHYTFQIEVTDGDATTTATVSIELQNIQEPGVNDRPDIDDQGLMLTENQAIVMPAVVAIDLDITENDLWNGTPDELTYSIVNLPGVTDSELFVIDAQTGEISVDPAQGSFDFETDKHTFTVLVRVTDVGGLQDTATVRIFLEDITGNEPPVITSDGAGDTASVDVPENTTGVTTVTVNDPDGGVPTYSISGGADQAFFQIDAATGVLIFINAPDFEAPGDVGADNGYEVTVTVDDNNGNTDSQTITVNVTDDPLANEVPVITSDGGGDTATIDVVENNAPVTTITVHDPDGDPAVFTISGGADAALFQIDAATGELSFVNPPDFETPLDVGADNGYEVIVTADDSQGNTDSQTITVSVLDDPGANEAPVITSDGAGDTASVDVPENTTGVTTVTVFDPDGAVPTYSISGGADQAFFQIDAATGVLIFINAPDFETPLDAGADNGYEVTVTVDDDNGNTDSQTITVNVTDDPLGNEVPVITSDGGGDTATIDVVENNAPVTTVTVHDPDGDPAVFTISGGADAALFQIDAATGELSFVNAPDFETPLDVGADNGYEVIVTADDSQGNTDSQTITINVLDDPNGNEAPVITSDGAGDTAAVDVAENSLAVTDVESFDPDGGVPTYSISGGADQAFFQIDAATGRLSFINAPDFETPLDAGADNDYEVTVSVDDGNGNTDSQTITVTVTDDPNSNEAPVITSDGGGDAAQIDVVENNAAVTQVVVSDPDGDPATFTLGGVDAALFSIDVNGNLVFVNAPDFEAPADTGADNNYDVTVTANDGNGNTDTQAITITVLDDTDPNEAPVITSDGGMDTASVDVAENSFAVTTVTSFDPDGGVPAFSIGGGADQALFAIDAVSGELTFINAPDFEAPGDAGADNSYEVTVTVEDGNGNTDSQAITVSVIDDPNANEAPVITSDGGGDTASIDMPESGTAVTTVTVNDPDGDPAVFTISGGVDAAFFSIDASTGALIFLAPPDFENPLDGDADNAYEVFVTADDSNANTDTQVITVNVTDGNEPPSAVDDTFATDEDTPFAGENLLAANPTVPDSDFNTDPLSITEINGVARVDTPVAIASGALVTVLADGTFAYDPNGSFEGLAVGDTATDTFTYTLFDGDDTDTATVTITIDGVNDAPVAVDDAYTTDEDTPIINGDLFAANPTTPDSDPDGDPFTVTAVLGDPGNVGNAIDLGSGATLTVRADGTFDFDPGDLFDFLAEGETSGSTFTYTISDGDLTDSAVVMVTITGVNDAPVITSNGGGSAAAIDVDENTTAVTTVASTDADGGAPSYRISGGADAARFSIDGSTGVLIFNSEPNFEAPNDSNADNDYIVEVAVDDGNGASDTQTITVSVQNVNEPTVITSNGGGANAAIDVDENTTAVTTVTATDQDGPVTFGITGGADQAKFTIDGSTGVLIFASAPDFEVPTDAGADNDYVVQITATDTVLGSTDVQTITVSVQDVNEAPTITSTAALNTTEDTIDLASPSTNGSGVFLTVAVSDVDAGDSHTFEITGGADQNLFTIDANSGELRYDTAGNLVPDFEIPIDANGDGVYQLEVTATDSGGLTDVQTINVTVTNRQERPTIDLDTTITGRDAFVNFDPDAPVPVGIAPAGSITDPDIDSSGLRHREIDIVYDGSVLDAGEEFLTVLGVTFDITQFGSGSLGTSPAGVAFTWAVALPFGSGDWDFENGTTTPDPTEMLEIRIRSNGTSPQDLQDVLDTITYSHTGTPTGTEREFKVEVLELFGFETGFGPQTDDSYVNITFGPAPLVAPETSLIVGTSGDEDLVGSETADQIQGQGGFDSFTGLGGDDLLIVNGNNFDFADGGTGYDTLRLKFGGTFDLSNKPNDILTSIEEIEINGDGKTVSLTAFDVLLATGLRDDPIDGVVLRISDGAVMTSGGSTLDFLGDGFVDTGEDRTIDKEAYSVYRHHDGVRMITVLVDDDVNVIGDTAATVVGTSGNDSAATMAGTTGADIFSALAGNDAIEMGTGADLAFLGAGDDVAVIRALQWLHIDGGEGSNDRLRIASSTHLDMQNQGENTIINFESVELAGGANQFSFTAADIFDMTSVKDDGSGRAFMRITDIGDSLDTVDFLGDGFVDTGVDEVFGGATYDVYRNTAAIHGVDSMTGDTVEVWVEQGIDVLGLG